MVRAELKEMVASGKMTCVSSWARGYVSRKSNTDKLEAEAYNGRYGKGYTVKTPSYQSTQYCNKEYYVFN